MVKYHCKTKVTSSLWYNNSTPTYWSNINENICPQKDMCMNVAVSITGPN